MSNPTPLADHLAWPESISGKPCTCAHEWKASRDYMPEWVRVSTEPGCQAHGEAAR